MPRFRKAEKQAAYAIRHMTKIGASRHLDKQKTDEPKKIHSVGTQRNYTQALTNVTKWIQKNHIGDLQRLNEKQAMRYLEIRSQEIGQKTLDQERQALQMYLKAKLPRMKSEIEQSLTTRAYTQDQVKMVVAAQSLRHALATQLAVSAGLRAHELLTLQRSSESTKSSHRTWSNDRFIGREGIIYTVKGKGGLVREVLIPKALAIELEKVRLENPKKITDREIHYHQYYNIGGDRLWSNSFTEASKRALGWSQGAHGLRHSYAQQRMEELQQHGFDWERALGTVSQEVGHFCSSLTCIYLR